MANPIGTVTNVSKSRISDESGMNQAVITVTFDQDIVEFKAMLNGADYLTGTVVDSQMSTGDRTVGSMSTMTVGSAATMTVSGLQSGGGETVGTMSGQSVSNTSAMTVGTLATPTSGGTLAIAGSNVYAIIDWNESLVEGSNRINLYGKNSAGEWSAYPA